IGPDPRNFNQRVSLGRNDLLIRTFLKLLNDLTSTQMLKIVVSVSAEDR
ncbi:fimbria/pilus outer membrane usher protein, partial [Klebsiella pneumoniae]